MLYTPWGWYFLICFLQIVFHDTLPRNSILMHSLGMECITPVLCKSLVCWGCKTEYIPPFNCAKSNQIKKYILSLWSNRRTSVIQTDPTLHDPVKFGSPSSLCRSIEIQHECGDDIRIRNEYFPIRIWPQVGLGLVSRCGMG